MSTQDLKNAKTLRKYGELLGREEIAKRVIELCKLIASEEHYKNSIVGLGHLKALAIACKYDSYWDEKCNIGFSDELYIAEKRIKQSRENVVMDKLIQQAQAQ